MSDWQMQRIESTSENPCCALVLEMGPYKATVYYALETQTWSIHVMQDGKLLHHKCRRTLFGAIGFAEGVVDNPAQPATMNLAGVCDAPA